MLHKLVHGQAEKGNVFSWRRALDFTFFFGISKNTVQNAVCFETPFSGSQDVSRCVLCAINHLAPCTHSIVSTAGPVSTFKDHSKLPFFTYKLGGILLIYPLPLKVKHFIIKIRYGLIISSVIET